jgi:hypothetical protein
LFFFFFFFFLVFDCFFFYLRPPILTFVPLHLSQLAPGSNDDVVIDQLNAHPILSSEKLVKSVTLTPTRILDISAGGSLTTSTIGISSGIWRFTGQDDQNSASMIITSASPQQIIGTMEFSYAILTGKYLFSASSPNFVNATVQLLDGSFLTSNGHTMTWQDSIVKVQGSSIDSTSLAIHTDFTFSGANTHCPSSWSIKQRSTINVVLTTCDMSLVTLDDSILTVTPVSNLPASLIFRQSRVNASYILGNSGAQFLFEDLTYFNIAEGYLTSSKLNFTHVDLATSWFAQLTLVGNNFFKFTDSYIVFNTTNSQLAVNEARFVRFEENSNVEFTNPSPVLEYATVADCSFKFTNYISPSPFILTNWVWEGRSSFILDNAEGYLQDFRTVDAIPISVSALGGDVISHLWVDTMASSMHQSVGFSIFKSRLTLRGYEIVLEPGIAVSDETGLLVLEPHASSGFMNFNISNNRFIGASISPRVIGTRVRLSGGGIVRDLNITDGELRPFGDLTGKDLVLTSSRTIGYDEGNNFNFGITYDRGIIVKKLTICSGTEITFSETVNIMGATLEIDFTEGWTENRNPRFTALTALQYTPFSDIGPTQLVVKIYQNMFQSSNDKSITILVSPYDMLIHTSIIVADNSSIQLGDCFNIIKEVSSPYWEYKLDFSNPFSSGCQLFSNSIPLAPQAAPSSKDTAPVKGKSNRSLILGVAIGVPIGIIIIAGIIFAIIFLSGSSGTTHSANDFHASKAANDAREAALAAREVEMANQMYR